MDSFSVILTASKAIEQAKQKEKTRFCDRCSEVKPDSDFPTAAGKICKYCKQSRQRSREDRINKIKAASVLNVWRKAWPHIKTKQ